MATKYALRLGDTWLTNTWLAGGTPHWAVKSRRMLFPTRASAYGCAAEMLQRLPSAEIRVVMIRRPLTKKFLEGKLGRIGGGGWVLDDPKSSGIASELFARWVQDSAGKDVRITLEVF